MAVLAVFMCLPYGRVLLFSVETGYAQRAKPVAFWPFLLFFCESAIWACFAFSVVTGYAQRAKPVAFGRS